MISLFNNDHAHIVYMTQYLTSLSKTNKHIIDEIIDDFKAARKSMGGLVPINMVPSLDISMLEPYDRLIIYSALKLQLQPEGPVIKDANWFTMLRDLIRYGCNRNEVTLILRTAKYEDVKHFIDLYDKTLCAMTTRQILSMEPIDSKSDVLSRKASLLAIRVSFSQIKFRAADWEDFLFDWILSKKDWSDLIKILNKSCVPPKRVTAIHKKFEEIKGGST